MEKRSEYETFTFFSHAQKRGQFFLLTAVIISVVVLSLGVTTNQAVFSEEPENFYDFSYEVEREVGAVIDYEVYSGFEDEVDLDAFVDLLSEDIKDRSPGSDFLFIYGDGDEVTLKGYVASDDSSKVCLGEVCQTVYGDLADWVSGSEYMEGGSDDEIVVILDEERYVFPTFTGKQVLFIMQKDVGDESYVSAG